MHMVNALEAGVVTAEPDALVHAVRMTLRGADAACGAGPIVGRVLARFGETDRQMCLVCFSTALDEPHAADALPTPARGVAACGRVSS